MMRTYLALIIALALFGCAGLPDDVVVLLPDEDGHTGRVEVRERGVEVELKEPEAAVGIPVGQAPGKVFTAEQTDIEAAFSGALGVTPRRPSSFLLFFANDSTKILPNSQPVLDQAIAAAKSMPNVDISVIGHTDATKLDSYNMSLSLERAEAIRDVLVAAGIGANVIELEYDAANNPLVPAPLGVAEPRNRCVEVTVR